MSDLVPSNPRDFDGEATTRPMPIGVKMTLRWDGLNTAWRLASTEAEARACPMLVKPEAWQ